MEYLANPFNHSVNTPHSDGISRVLNMVSLNLFYYILFAISIKLEDIRKEEDVLEGSDYIKEVPDMVFENVFDDETVDVKEKKDLISLLDINSLERNYILYYIFKKRESFYNGESDINTYTYYKKVVNDWRNIYFVDDNMSFTMSLDESLENDYQIVIDNIICDANIAHVRFLSWLYYSGIYSYLMNNQEIKKTVLNDMNNKKLLTGNLFLKYHFYLIEMENKENKDIIEEESNTANISANTEKENQSQSQLEIQEINNEEDMNTDDLVEESVNADGDNGEIDNEDDNESDNEDDNESENEDDNESENEDDNEDELNNRPISEDISELHEKTFASKLLTTVRNITIRTLVGTWNIIKEEAVELFHPLLD